MSALTSRPWRSIAVSADRRGISKQQFAKEQSCALRGPHWALPGVARNPCHRSPAGGETSCSVASLLNLSWHVIHHPDQDSQYTSPTFGTRCSHAGIPPRWALSETATITPWPRASSPASSANCSTRPGFGIMQTRRRSSSGTSRAGTTPLRRHSAIGPRSLVNFEKSYLEAAWFPNQKLSTKPGNSTLA